MTADASQLTNLKLRPAGYVTCGDNNRGRILGVGDIEEIDKVIIKDVLLVEGLKHSLLSISQLCDKGKLVLNITSQHQELHSRMEL